ncbi:hypothetical protein BaRGS_00013964 [Batillaria attramentaria]|uniref:Uncharacterized protein n=1 Tax=Batillaria attramentaria TaxID=370345 RepID=A0ABD0L5W3_9CAEN
MYDVHCPRKGVGRPRPAPQSPTLDIANDTPLSPWGGGGGARQELRPLAWLSANENQDRCTAADEMQRPTPAEARVGREMPTETNTVWDVMAIETHGGMLSLEREIS